MNYFIGIMSGTSLDGIDIVLAEFAEKITCHHQAEYPYPGELKETLLALSQGAKISLAEIGRIDHLLGKTYAAAVNRFIDEFAIDKAQIAAIGCHGQTVYHQPNSDTPFSMQLGDANLIAALTGITTIADFRRKDIAFGGQGAPLVPAFHQALFSQKAQTCIVLNIGGIANISILNQDSVQGFDTGPGNMLMDSWIWQHLRQPFDKDGAWAATGKINPALLARLLQDPYFAKPIPKSTGREHFHLGWLEQQLRDFSALAPQDVQASLLALTVQSIANDVNKFPAGELLVCGGGARNGALMQALATALPGWQVMRTNDKGVDADSLEAMAFAWLAYRTLNRKTGSLPSVTGASQASILGAIYYPD